MFWTTSTDGIAENSGLYLTVTKEKTYFSASGGNTNVFVKTNGEYSLLLPNDGWISSRKYETNGYNLFVSPNTSKEIRKMPVKIVATKGSEIKEETFNITQEGKKSLWWVWLIVAFVIVFITVLVIATNQNKTNNYSTTQTETKATQGYLNGHEWVDLGLPSGTKWATCNVGARTPSDYGNHYAWGEIWTKKSYSQNNYNYSGNSKNLSANADVATASWGYGWRMPTEAEMSELRRNCEQELTDRNGVTGWVFSGLNGNSIFIPAAGVYRGSELLGEGAAGSYWSSSLCSNNYTMAVDLGFNIDDNMDNWIPKLYNNNRYYGFSVRPVCE